MSEFQAVGAADFATEVEASQLPVLVDFWAPWCGPCKALTPILEGLAEDLKGKLRIVKVNVDDEGDLALRYGVQAIPALIYFRDGKVQDKMVGYMSKDAIKRRIGLDGN